MYDSQFIYGSSLESSLEGLFTKEAEKNMSEIEYLAIPYTHSDLFVLNGRALIADAIAAALIKKGRIVYSSISCWHHIAMNHKMELDWRTWAKLDEEFIKISKKVLVIMLSGWKKSVGVQAEIKIAEKFNIQIEYLNPSDLINLDDFKEEK
jgi:hypothetical protein